jgi:hypothetical protein
MVKRRFRESQIQSRRSIYVASDERAAGAAKQLTDDEARRPHAPGAALPRNLQTNSEESAVMSANMLATYGGVPQTVLNEVSS